MKHSAWPLLCIALAAGAAAQVRPIEEDSGRPQGRGERNEGAARPERGQNTEHAPQAPAAPAAAPSEPPRRIAVPAPAAPPAVPTPRFGLPPGSTSGGERANRPADRPSNPAEGHWSTPGVGERRNDDNRRDDGWRNDGRRVDPRAAEPPRVLQPRDDRAGSRDDWQRSRAFEPPRRVYQWRDYDRYRAQNFRFDGGRYYARSRYRIGAFLWPRGFGVRSWLIGEWLPSTFFLDSRYLLDYWRFGLYEPPAGARWVRVGDDALLVDDFDGEVLDAIYNLFW
jgi:Ni/Co efflux regulator RcnB